MSCVFVPTATSVPVRSLAGSPIAYEIRYPHDPAPYIGTYRPPLPPRRVGGGALYESKSARSAGGAPCTPPRGGAAPLGEDVHLVVSANDRTPAPSEAPQHAEDPCAHKTDRRMHRPGCTHTHTLSHTHTHDTCGPSLRWASGLARVTRVYCRRWPPAAAHPRCPRRRRA